MERGPCRSTVLPDGKIPIVSDDYHLKGIDISANITVKKNIPYSEYLTLLENSRLVVVPLTKHVMSTGQVVILEAMALGKPVIATETVARSYPKPFARRGSRAEWA